MNQQRDRPRTYVYGFFALVLLLAAGLKAYALFAGQSIQDGWSNDPRLRLLTIEWEVVLGFFLLIGRSDFYRWVFAFLAFASFAVVSGVLGVRGAASCGCLGIIRVNPWWMFLFDLAAMVVLVNLHPLRLDFKQARYVVLAGAIAAIAFTGMAVANIGAPKDLVGPELREIGIQMPQEVNVGAGRGGEWREASVEIVNRRSEPVLVYGGSYGCGLDFLADCPSTIPPGAAINLRVRFRLPNEIDQYKADGSFFVSTEDGATTWAIPVSLTGATLANPY